MSESLRRVLGGLRLDETMVLFEHVDQQTYRCSLPAAGLELPVLIRAYPPNLAGDPDQPNPSDQEVLNVAWEVICSPDLDPSLLSPNQQEPRWRNGWA